jgi:uncharacterized protein (DUF58 family)
VARRRSVAFLVSDFLADNWGHAVRVAGQRHDLVPVVIGDPMEEQLPRLGLVTFEDFETGEILEFDTSGPEGREYAAWVARKRDEREQLLKRMSVDFVNVRTDRPYVDALVAFFRARERRMRH